MRVDEASLRDDVITWAIGVAVVAWPPLPDGANPRSLKAH